MGTRESAAARRTIEPLRLVRHLSVPTSDCWCPRAPGVCCPPYDLQPASLVRSPRPLDVTREAAIVLSGSVLELLLAGLPLLAAHHAERLAGLLDLTSPDEF